MEQLTYKELSQIKPLDKTLNILFEAEEFLPSIEAKKGEEFYKQFILIINDVLHGFNQVKVFKNPQDFLLLSSYFTMDGVFST